MTRFPTIIAFAMLSGCAASSVDDLKAHGANTYKFHTDLGYQAAYRNIVNVSRQCWSGSVLLTQMGVDADLYNDTETGEVTFWITSPMKIIHATALITKAANSGSEVTVWNYYTTWNGIGPRVERWVRGSTSCE